MMAMSMFKKWIMMMKAVRACKGYRNLACVASPSSNDVTLELPIIISTT